MKKGEKMILGIIGLSIIVMFAINYWRNKDLRGPDAGIPFYSTASPELANAAMAIIRREQCRECHVLWSLRDPTQAVPAPSLDGLGSLKDESWFYSYLSAENPQAIVPSRLKLQYRMRAYNHLPEAERRTLAQYLASLKVQDWYRSEVMQAERRALEGIDEYERE